MTKDHGHRESAQALARRVVQIRCELFGEHGAEELARRLGVPPRTWAAYEQGVIMPATVILRFVELTRTNPRWLLTGDGERYAHPPAHGRSNLDN